MFDVTTNIIPKKQQIIIVTKTLNKRARCNKPEDFIPITTNVHDK